MRATAAACLGLLATASATAFAQAPATIVVGAFSSSPPGAALPADWQPLTFEKILKHTRYELVHDGDGVVVKATSHASASGLIRRIRIDPNEYPIVQWRWKVGGILQKGDVGRKAGDDYPARLYVTFEYDPKRASFADAVKYRTARAIFGPDTPYRAISYIWDSKAPRDTFVPNSYTDWTMMVVVRSGADEAGRWLVEERNILEDFRRAFGTDAPAISGVAIMTDTDNTQESAAAWYGDILFRKRDRPR